MQWMDVRALSVLDDPELLSLLLGALGDECRDLLESGLAGRADPARAVDELVLLIPDVADEDGRDHPLSFDRGGEIVDPLEVLPGVSLRLEDRGERDRADEFLVDNIFRVH